VSRTVFFIHWNYFNLITRVGGGGKMIYWLASYPRSGNTFVRSVLQHFFEKKSYSIHRDRLDIAATRELKDIVGHIEGDKTTLKLDELRRSKDPVFIKTHDLPCAYMSCDDVAIHIIRDGRDSAVSFIKYYHRIAKHRSKTLLDILVGDCPFGFWGEHSVAWFSSHFHNTYRFRYEDIVRAPELFADNIGDIISRKRSAAPFPSLDSFRSTNPNFCGSGQTGTFRDHFSQFEEAVFHLYSGPAMRLAGYEGSALSPEEQSGYSAFCSQIRAAREHVRTSPLKDAELNKLSTEHSALKAQFSALVRSNEELEKRHNRLKRISGLHYILPLVPQSVKNALLGD
jgi:hypothetical protein